MSAKFWYYPQPDGRHLVEIDLDEPIAELQSALEYDAVDGVTQSGGIYRSIGRGGESVSIQRDRMQLGEDLAIQFDALQNHLDRGFACAFVTDYTKAWCAALSSPPQAGLFTVNVKDAVFSSITGTSVVPVAGDYVVIETDSPPYIREVQKIASIDVTAASGGNVTFTKRLNFDYSNRLVFMRWYRFWPLLKRAQGGIGSPIITNESGRLFSLNVDLVVDYKALFAFHNGAGFSINLGVLPPATGDLEDQSGTFTLDTGGRYLNTGSAVSDKGASINLTTYNAINKGLF